MRIKWLPWLWGAILIASTAYAQKGWFRETGDHIQSSPLLVDLNGNGKLEILVLSFDNKIYIYNHDGTTFNPNGSGSSPWPLNLGTDFGDGTISSVAVGDIDAAPDHKPEIVVVGDKSGDNQGTCVAVRVYKIDGTLLASNNQLNITARR